MFGVVNVYGNVRDNLYTIGYFNGYIHVLYEQRGVQIKYITFPVFVLVILA